MTGADCAPWCTDHRTMADGERIITGCRSALTEPGVGALVTVGRIIAPGTDDSCQVDIGLGVGRPADAVPFRISPENARKIAAALLNAADIAERAAS